MVYIKDNKKYDSTSPKNFEIISNFVNREVLCFSSPEIDFMLDNMHLPNNTMSMCAEEIDLSEVMEWWAVTIWFGEKLSQKGCVVVKAFGKSFWGRKTSGQSITLDECVAQIALDCEILEEGF